LKVIGPFYLWADRPRPQTVGPHYCLSVTNPFFSLLFVLSLVRVLVGPNQSSTLI